MRIQIADAMSSSINNDRPQGRATGAITVVAKADLANGDFFTVTDWEGRAWKFIYDTDGTQTPAAGEFEVDVSGDTTAAHVRDRTITTMRAASKIVGGLTVYFADAVTLGANARGMFDVAIGGSAVINLRSMAPGTIGNQTITENVANAGFTVAGMSGAIDVTETYEAGKGVKLPRPKQGYLTDTAMLEIFSIAGSGTMTGRFRLWGRSRHTFEFYPLGIAPDSADDTTRGVVNAGVTMAEIGDVGGTDNDIHFMAAVDLTDDLDAAYLQPLAAGGSDQLFDAYLTAGR